MPRPSVVPFVDALLGQPPLKFYGRLPSPKVAILGYCRPPRSSFVALEFHEETCLDDPIEDTHVGPRRPLAYRFDFIEVFAGAAKVTASMQRLGIPGERLYERFLNLEAL